MTFGRFRLLLLASIAGSLLMSLPGLVKCCTQQHRYMQLKEGGAHESLGQSVTVTAQPSNHALDSEKAGSISSAPYKQPHVPTPTSPKLWGSLVAPATLMSSIRVSAVRLNALGGHAVRGRVEDSSGGRYVFDSLDPGRYVLEAFAPGFAPVSELVRIEDNSIQGPHLEVGLGGIIRGRVVATDERGAMLDANGMRSLYLRKRNDNGAADFPCVGTSPVANVRLSHGVAPFNVSGVPLGLYDLEVRDTTFSEWGEPEATFSINVWGEVDTGDLAVEVHSWRVGAMIRAPNNRDQKCGAELLVLTQETVYAFEASAGSFSAEGLPSGECLMFAHQGEYASSWSHRILARGERVDMGVIDISFRSKVMGTLRDAGGILTHSSVVTMAVPTDHVPVGAEFGVPMLLDEEGTFGHVVPPGRYELRFGKVGAVADLPGGEDTFTVASDMALSLAPRAILITVSVRNFEPGDIYELDFYIEAFGRERSSVVSSSRVVRTSTFAQTFCVGTQVVGILHCGFRWIGHLGSPQRTEKIMPIDIATRVASVEFP